MPEECPQIVEGFDKSRFQRDGLFVMLFGFLRALKVFEEGGKVIVRSGQVRIEGQGFFKIFQGLCEIVLFMENPAEGVIDFCLIRVDFEDF